MITQWYHHDSIHYTIISITWCIIYDIMAHNTSTTATIVISWAFTTHDTWHDIMHDNDYDIIYAYIYVYIYICNIIWYHGDTIMKGIMIPWLTWLVIQHVISLWYYIISYSQSCDNKTSLKICSEIPAIMQQIAHIIISQWHDMISRWYHTIVYMIRASASPKNVIW